MLARHELDDTSKELLAAADYIEKHGWIKGMRLNNDGKVCALGALDQARGAINPTGHVLDFWKFAHDRTPSVSRLARALGYSGQPSLYSGPAYAIAVWNNEPDRTAEDVINKMREVAYDPQYAKV